MPFPPSNPPAQGPSAQSETFRVRARVEANRYGPDPWIFVRELLQNARDANATKVEFIVQENSDGLQIRCRDNGDGMDFDHARRYLFSLYSSSKENRLNQIGRFGVGFWSILRFEPEQITICSSTLSGQTWQVSLDGDLRQAVLSHPTVNQTGTEVALFRSNGDGSHDRRIFDAAQQNGRFLRQRNDPEQPLQITVNGNSVNQSFSLPPPSLSFSRSKVRGVVALGQTPGVELFSLGLRVRSAGCLEDLLSTQFSATHSRVRFAELPDSLAPRVLLESDDLDLVLSRNEARESRSLRRLVALAQRELKRLVDHQLESMLPPSMLERLTYRLRHALVLITTGRVRTLSIMVSVVLLSGLSFFIWPETDTDTIGASEQQKSRVESAETNSSAILSKYEELVHSRSVVHSFQDLHSLYSGPQVSESESGSRLEIDLSYDPPTSPVYFKALSITSVAGMADRSARQTGQPYRGKRCPKGKPSSTCMQLSLTADFRAGILRLPLPTGYVLDEHSVRFPSSLHPVPVTKSEAFEPMVAIDASMQGPITYQASLGVENQSQPSKLNPPSLPKPFLDRAQTIKSMRDLPSKISSAIAFVRQSIRYDRSREISELHDRALRGKQSFIERSIDIGAGDCDVQNGVLVALLQNAGVSARLAIGYVGQRGKISPWLHAWAETRLQDNQPWTVADATPPTRIVPAHPKLSQRPHLRRYSDDSKTASNISEGRSLLANAADTNLELTSDHSAPTIGLLQEASSPSPLNTPWIGGDPTSRDTLLILAIIAAFGTFFAALYHFLSKSRPREMDLDPQVNLAGLLQGVFSQPETLQTLPSLSLRKLIPRLDGEKLSLQHARNRLARGQLYSAHQSNILTDIFQRRGGTVIDSRSKAGRLVAETLGAINLDDWMGRIAKHKRYPIIDALNSYLLQHRYSSAVVTGEDTHQFITVLNLPRHTTTLFSFIFRLGKKNDKHSRHSWGRISNLVMINSKDDSFISIAEEFVKRPQTALLWLLEHVSANLDLDHYARTSLLYQQAGAAISEQVQQQVRQQAQTL